MKYLVHPFKKIALFFVSVVISSGIAFAAVDANKANQADLETIKGIGPAISKKILAERNKGSFKDWSDFVDRVPGIGEKNAAKMSEAGLTVNSASYKGAPAKTDSSKKAKADSGVAADEKESKKDKKKAEKEAKKAKSDEKK